MQDRKVRMKFHKERKSVKNTPKKKGEKHSTRSHTNKVNEGYEADDEDKTDEFSLAYQQVSLQVKVIVFCFKGIKNILGSAFCYLFLY